VTEPLVVEFEVDAPRSHAFAMWTGRCALWWPRSHTISGDPAAIDFPPRPGGRIVERASDGVEHDWGEVLDWEPPVRVRYLWHLFFDRGEATEVEVTFAERDGRTVVRIEQTGWERLGDAGPPRRARTGQAWAAIAERLRQACAQSRS
jgi:uncharacterized protein YndB with AHSA1/START domain